MSSGQVMVGVNSNGFAPFVDGGKLRLVVTFGEHRTRRWPQVPTPGRWATASWRSRPTTWRAARRAGGRGARAARRLQGGHARPGAPGLERYDQDLAYLGPEDYGRAMRETHAAERRTVERLGLARGTP
ncbi:MAG: hypothetical protein U1F56_13815 [Rubrivivax sp.]